jgi:3-oxoacyl-[acyl-carrier protein] reductase
VARLDLADPASIHEAVAGVVDRWGGIDVLVANAADTTGHSSAFDPRSRGFEATPPERWWPLLRTIVDGTFHTAQAVLASMRDRGWGRLVLVSSAAAERGGPREQAYAAGKAALSGLAASLAGEFGPHGILVNVVMPALTTTERVLATVPAPAPEAIAGRLATRRLSTPDDVAAVIVFLCSASNGNVTGETVHVTGGL